MNDTQPNSTDRDEAIEAARDYLDEADYCFRPTSGEPLLSHVMADLAIEYAAKENAELRAENERLRQALEEIESDPWSCSSAPSIAREALEQVANTKLL